MIIDTTYKVSAGGKIFRITTSLTEREFYHTLDGVYGCNNYAILDVC